MGQKRSFVSPNCNAAKINREFSQPLCTFFLLSLAFTVEVLLDNYCGCAILARNTEDLLIVIAYCLCHAFLSWFLAAGTAADDAEIGSIATVM